MQGARDLWHPAKVSDVRNKKHQLKNDLLSFIEEKELMCPEKEVSDVGDVFCLITKKSVKNYENLQKFFDHCCQARHYSFCIKSVERMVVIFASQLDYLVKSLTRLASYLILYHKMMGIIRTSKKCLGLSLTEDHRPSL